MLNSFRLVMKNKQQSSKDGSSDIDGSRLDVQKLSRELW